MTGNRKPIFRLWCPLCFFCLVVFAACGPTPGQLGLQAFYAYEYDDAAKYFRQAAAAKEKNQALYFLHLASAKNAKFNRPVSFKSLLNATGMISSLGGDRRGLLSLIGNESVKIFKGEPFEKVMAFIYLGLYFLNDGDLENARACFRKALLFDKESKKGFGEDGWLTFYLLAKTLVELGDDDNAKIALEKAAKISYAGYGDNPKFTVEDLKSHNAIFVVELGRAPRKTRTGPGASLDTFETWQYPETRALLNIGPVHKTSFLGLDLEYEAKTRGSSGKDAIQATKGVVRDAAIVTAVVSDNKKVQAAALLTALLVPSQADIPQWNTLPGKLHLVAGNISPGEYRLNLRFLDASGTVLPDFSQTWQNVKIEVKPKVYVLRSGPGKPSGMMLDSAAEEMDPASPTIKEKE